MAEGQPLSNGNLIPLDPGFKAPFTAVNIHNWLLTKGRQSRIFLVCFAKLKCQIIEG